MNKVVAILGVIVLITLGALFFCAGFFTASTIPALQMAEQNANAAKAQDSKPTITAETIESKLKAKSSAISNKIIKILSAAGVGDEEESNHPSAGHATSQKLSTDVLLKEIASAHFDHDDCSVMKTVDHIQNPKRPHPSSLHGKTIVFIGYFKNNIALQIQRTLISKGYKVHVEQSRNAFDESFVFCGPFQKVANATKLASWLKQHSFSSAKVINVPSENMDALIPDGEDDDDDLPNNEEQDIPEITHEQMAAIQNHPAEIHQMNQIPQSHPADVHPMNQVPQSHPADVHPMNQVPQDLPAEVHPIDQQPMPPMYQIPPQMPQVDQQQQRQALQQQLMQQKLLQQQLQQALLQQKKKSKKKR